MEQERINALAATLAGQLCADRLVPADLFAAVERCLGEDGLRAAAAVEWAAKAKARAAQGKPALDPVRPLILSRGFGAAVAEEELANYLPEEKILVNRELFRGVLDGVDFATVPAAQERLLMDRLQRESVGLRPEDVSLYYNLIKVNKLAAAKRNGGGETAQLNPEQAAAELLKLADAAFGLSGDTFARINGGRAFPDRNLAIKVLADSIERRKLNPLLTRNLLGRKTDKHLHLLVEFLRRVADQRGEDAGELLLYTGAYLLFNGTTPDNLTSLNLAAPLQAYLTDKIGKVRTVYYAAMLFILSFQFILLAQLSEVSAKYADAPEDQRAKLRKLYEAEDRRALLVTNSVNVASRKLAEYRGESREILSALRAFLQAHGDLVQAEDLFGIDYRT